MKIIKFNIKEAELSASFIFCRKFSFVPLIHIVSIANQCRKQYNLLDEYNEDMITHAAKLLELEEQAEAAVAQRVEQENKILALDYLWRIEREYCQKRYSSARSLIRAFEQAGLEEYRKHSN